MNDPYNTTGERAVPKNVRPLGVKKKAPIPNDNWDVWGRIRKIARLAGKNPKIRICPVQVAAATLEKAQAGRMASIFVSIEWDDGTHSSDWCQMKSSQLTAHAFNVQADVRDALEKT
jgi:hypothetical protein